MKTEYAKENESEKPKLNLENIKLEIDDRIAIDDGCADSGRSFTLINYHSLKNIGGTPVPFTF